MSVLDLIRPDLQDITPYVPTGDELGTRLHANELPWSPSSLNEVALNHYPNARNQQKLQERMARYFQVNNEEIVLTRGSDDGIDLLMRVFLQAGIDSILQCPPTFPMYSFYARLQQAGTLNCPLDSKNNFSLSTKKLMATWQTNCKLIMLCRPNNPTGNLLDLAEIKQLCDHFTNRAVVVVDEAYIDFAKVPSAVTLLRSFDNLIVLRTLSKACGLAGLRLGAVIAQPQVIKALRNAMPPYTLSSAVIALAKDALENKEWFESNIQRILHARAELVKQFQQCNWIETIYPSHANFILVSSPHAPALTQWLAQHDIAIRYFAHPPLQNMMRITVGDEMQNKQLLTVLNSFKP
ncbi:histidinol-phosphate transaminase [Legionella brunensis]|uniref:Histidinol-phosphate aminotransferase n=1 Tax=Legionella brunensis TaxID=29422 RepID=A0A0W0ST83_9GAMM|nr:histidinol-phosphate transaminase [Legionella brunensis]KTC86484.1 histidinol-phosphate aminotransferase (imidazole acetol-phosphate transaminase) [Legionella brunensis]